VWSRNRYDYETQRLNYDVLLYVANWPQIRVNAWETLLRARAIENLSYVVGVNRIGNDPDGMEYSGNSAVIGPKGDTIFSVDGVEQVKTIELSANALLAFRDKFPAYLDADDFSIEMREFEEY
jgi:predicted amidohydrolase